MNSSPGWWFIFASDHSVFEMLRQELSDLRCTAAGGRIDAGVRTGSHTIGVDYGSASDAPNTPQTCAGTTLADVTQHFYLFRH